MSIDTPSPAETRVLRLLVHGDGPTAIADLLGKSVETVNGQIRTMKLRAQVKTTKELVAMALERGWTARGYEPR